MKKSHTQHSPVRHHQAFTLVELLVVIAIVSLLLAITGLGIGSSISSMQLGAAANELNATLNHAALLARKENRPVQVRFYKFATSDFPDAQFRSYQLAALNGISASNEPIVELLSEMHQLPSGVILAPNAEYNTLALLPEKTQTATDPVIGTNYSYTSYEIRPNGLTSLPKNPPAVITLLLENQMTSSNSLPANYRSILINPQNARAKVY